MSTKKVKDLIKTLQDFDQEKEIEYIVVDTTGHLIGINISKVPEDMIRLLKMFDEVGL